MDVRSVSPEEKSDYYTDDETPEGSVSEDIDASKWFDEDELDELDLVEEHAVRQPDNKELSTPSFGALAKANKLLRRNHHHVASPQPLEGGSESLKYADANEPSSSKTHNHTKHIKRIDKHAPMEVTSKKPVSRKRTIVELTKIERRDPRFSSLSGDFNASMFSSSYSFITSIQSTELAEVKTSLYRARKLFASSPAHLREERAQEMQRLERTLKRLESNIERASREKRNREALTKRKREESGAHAKGKGIWHMKTPEKNKLLSKARFEQLAQEGGKAAVRKAIAKRQVKISQKEKRSRPDGGAPYRLEIRTGTREPRSDEMKGKREGNSDDSQARIENRFKRRKYA